jgi:GAF domain-containing protein
MTFEQFQQKLKSADSREKAYALAVGHLKDRDRFDWTGVYSLEDPETLVLRAFVGKPTDHTRIPVGKGICGTAVAQGEDQRVDDVHSVDNYLACSLDTKSEMVVLIRHGDEIYAQLDIDSDTKQAFSDDDYAAVKRVADELAAHFHAHPSLPERPRPRIAGSEDRPENRNYYALCAICKGEIAWGATWFRCTVSTCNRTRTALRFCSSECWDSHLPEARHRDPAFEEKQAPAKPSTV